MYDKSLPYTERQNLMSHFILHSNVSVVTEIYLLTSLGGKGIGEPFHFMYVSQIWQVQYLFT